MFLIERLSILIKYAKAYGMKNIYGTDAPSLILIPYLYILEIVTYCSWFIQYALIIDGITNNKMIFTKNILFFIIGYKKNMEALFKWLAILII